MAGLSKATDVAIDRHVTQIDFAGFETGRLESKIEIDDGKLLQRFAEQPIVPGGDFGQAIVGDRKGAALGFGKMLETNGRDFGKPKEFRSGEASMASDDIVRAVDENGHVEPKTLNAAGDLTNLLLGVDADVPGIKLQLLDGEIANGQKGSMSGTLCRPGDGFSHVASCTPAQRAEDGLGSGGAPKIAGRAALIEFRKRRKK
jgi:hypothetical protein